MTQRWMVSRERRTSKRESRRHDDDVIALPQVRPEEPLARGQELLGDTLELRLPHHHHDHH
jgi:hypothetical protein